MMPNQSAILALPKQCRLEALSTVLLFNADSVVNFLGINEYKSPLLNQALQLFFDQQSKASKLEVLIPFYEEKSKIWIDGDYEMCNPREVIWSLHLALEIMQLGQGRDPACVLRYRPALRHCELNHFTFLIQEGFICPIIDWGTLEPTQGTMKIINHWIKTGRDLLPAEDRTFLEL
jgi:hypothetical protein